MNINSNTAPVINITTQSVRVPIDPDTTYIEITNLGLKEVFAVCGDENVVAEIPTSEPKKEKIILPGTKVRYSKPPSATHVAIIAPAGSTTVYVSTGLA